MPRWTFGWFAIASVAVACAPTQDGAADPAPFETPAEALAPPLAKPSVVESGSARCSGSSSLVAPPPHAIPSGGFGVTTPEGRVVVGRALSYGLEVYDPSADVWMPSVDFNRGAWGGNAMALEDGTVLIFGGIVCGAKCNAMASAFTYDPRTAASSTIASTNNAHAGDDVVLLGDGRVLVSSGVAGLPGRGGTELYDPTVNRWVFFEDQLPGGHATLLADGRVLVVNRDSARVFDPIDDSIRLSEPPPAITQGGRVVRLRSGAVLLTADDGAAWIWSPATDRFRPTARAPRAIEESTVATLGCGAPIFIGGRASQRARSSAVLYDEDHDAWAEIPLVRPRARSVAVTLRDGGVLVVSGGDDKDSLLTAERIAPIALQH